MNLFYNTQHKKYYEKAGIVREYTKFSPIWPEEKKIFEKYHKSIKNKAVLDIGCGGGRTTESLKDMTTDYTGIDYSEKMIEACKRKFRESNLIHCDASEMSVLGNKKYDFISFSFNGLDSMTHDKRIKTLREICNRLKTDGIFTFSTHNRDFKRKATVFELLGLNMIRNIWHIYSYLKGRKHQIHHETYEIVSDHFDFGYLMYFISKSHQVKQLEDAGFRTIEIINCECESTTIDAIDSDSNCFHYVCTTL